MNRIEPYPLWIGRHGEGQNFVDLFDLGIEAVVDLAAEEAPRATPRELIVCRFPLIDGGGNRLEWLGLTVGVVAGLIASNVPTLVCCGAGMSRAPAVTALALASVRREAPEDCLKRVGLHHPHDVAPQLWLDLLAALPRARQLTPDGDRGGPT